MPDGSFQRIVGTYRRFGGLGPLYKVLGVERDLEGGDALLRILLVESDEETEYRFSHAAADPIAD